MAAIRAEAAATPRSSELASELASGLPLITTDAPPMNEFVEEGVNGRLVAVEKYQRRADNYYWPESICSEASLAKAMQHYIDHYDRIDEYRAGARRYAEERLDWKKNSGCLADAIGSMPRSDRIDPALRQSIVRYEQSRSTSRLSPHYWLNKLRR
jgi:glycosyltransferase involved in cell wall biosynthesis